jgi:ribosome-binding protein aMBF1 (putative translation factor)
MKETSLAIRSSGADSVRESATVDGVLLEREKRALLIRKTIGDLIRLQRTKPEAPLSQEELASRAGISYEHLNRLENYKTKVSLEILDRIAGALGFKRTSEFLARDDDKIL